MTTPPLVILHIGTMKSGTTYLQARLEHNRERLADDGVLFPGPQWKDQLFAARGAMTRARAGHDLRDGAGRWGRMRAQLLGWAGDQAILSIEHLSRASSGQARAVVASLEPCAVRVVVTARDLGRAIPSAWQQDLKGGSHESFTTFVRAVATAGGADVAEGLRGTGDADSDDASARSARHFWQLHDPAVHVRRWSAAVGADNLTVVTVPPPGSPPDLLWQRFCEAVGLDDGGYPAEGDDLVLNPSLGAAGAEVVRRVNERLHRLPDSLPQSVHRDLVKFTIANSTLAGVTGDETLQVPQCYSPWLATRARTMIDEIRASEVRVVGDLADLLPERSTAVRTGDRPPASTVSDAAVRASAALIRRAVMVTGAARTSRTRRTILAEQVAAARQRAAEDSTAAGPAHAQRTTDGGDAAGSGRGAERADPDKAL